MKMTENKPSSGLRHCIGAPKRFLRRARDLYIDSMLSFDCKVGTTNSMACPVTLVSNPPKNFGGHNPKKLDDNENLEELYRSISNKYNWRSTESNKVRTKCGTIDRSYSVAIGKIGTINEEEPCDFKEDVAMKNELLFPRSRSHAIGRRNNVIY